MLEKIVHIVTRPKFFITFLSYYVFLLGMKTVFRLNFVNRFTSLLIPLTLVVIYIIWNLFYNENLSDEMHDASLREKYFDKMGKLEKKNIENLMEIREVIQKLSTKTNLNPSKQTLIDELTSFDLNDMVEKYAINCVKIKFIDDFVNSKSYNIKSIKDKIDKLELARNKYKKLNDEIYNTFEEIRAQTVLLLTDNIVDSDNSTYTLDDIKKRIEVIDNTNSDINSFYLSINRDNRESREMELE